MVPKLRALCTSLTWLLALAATAHAEDDGARARLAMQNDEPRVTLELLVHPEDFAAQETRVGVLVDLAPGWHVYGAEAGETGLPTEVKWAASGGDVRSLPWPPTETFGDEEVGYTGQGYAGRVLLPAVARFGSGGERSVRAEVSLLACADECIPAEATLQRAWTATGLPPDAAARARAAFGAGPAKSGATRTAGGSEGLLQALLLALAGGLLLNLMPCVLPVLAIKAVALVELGGQHRSEARRHAAAYATGVLASMLALAAVVVALRAAGTAVGWGFQFQEPLYVAALGALLVLFALNLFGVFEIQAGTGALGSLGAQATGARRSFFDGLLTVALATPCSAPFLGTAVGFALGRDALVIFAIFAAIGTGLFLPLALAGVHPALGRVVPRPGAWMQDLRAVLGFALLATVVWLLWILGRSAGLDVAVRWLAWLLLVALFGWLHGVRQRRGRRAPAWLAVATAAGLLTLGVGAVRVAPVGSEAELPSREWSRNDVDAALRVGRPVFVYFTADWCITCKANERLVLRDPEVLAALADFEVLVGDWTRRDPAISREMQRYGRSGVPFYAVFAPDARPRVLPEVVTVASVLEVLETARRDTKVSRITRAAHAPSMQRRRTH